MVRLLPRKCPSSDGCAMTPSDLARISSWCKPDDDGCQIWQGATCSGHPCIRVKEGEKWFTRLVRKVLWEHHEGTLRTDCLVTASCGDSLCISDEHRVAVNRSVHYTKKRVSTPLTALQKQKRAEFRRAHYAKLTPEQVQEIFVSTEPTRAVGAKYGIDKSMVSRIRAGKAWKTYTGLWSGLGGR